jgi:hypothetical protein
VSLAAISEETKIKVSLLEGLERDDLSHWPQGIFRRAYVRSYARAIGLDPETLVRECLETHPEPDAVDPFTAASTRPRRAGEEGARAERDPVASEAQRGPAAPPPRPEPTLTEAASLCTRLGRIVDAAEAAPVLEDAVRTLDAVGLIVWSWDRRAAALRAALAHGYGDAVLAQMPDVRPDAENAIAAAFRSRQLSVVNGGAGVTGAVAVPIMAHDGCSGVLAVELRHGDEQREAVRAFAAILAAQLVPLVASVPLAAAVNA